MNTPHLSSSSSSGTLKADEVAHYYQHGYVIVPGLVDPATVEATRRAIDDFIFQHPDKVLYEPDVLARQDPLALPPEERLLAVRGIHHLVARHQVPHFRQLARYAPLVDALVSLLGGDIKLLQDMCLIKPPRVGSEKPPHQDAAYFEFEPFDQVVGTWWALEEATLENGCMCVWPGTHRLPVVSHTHREGTPHLIIDAEVIDMEARLPLPMRPGDVLFFASRLFHFTPSNRSCHRRRAVQMHYASSLCVPLPGKTPALNARPLIRGREYPGSI